MIDLYNPEVARHGHEYGESYGHEELETWSIFFTIQDTYPS